MKTNFTLEYLHKAGRRGSMKRRSLIPSDPQSGVMNVGVGTLTSSPRSLGLRPVSCSRNQFFRWQIQAHLHFLIHLGSLWANSQRQKQLGHLECKDPPSKQFSGAVFGILINPIGNDRKWNKIQILVAQTLTSYKLQHHIIPCNPVSDTTTPMD